MPSQSAARVPLLAGLLALSFPARLVSHCFEALGEALRGRREFIERLASDALDLIRERLDQLFYPSVVASKAGRLLSSTARLALARFVHRRTAYSHAALKLSSFESVADATLDRFRWTAKVMARISRSS